MSGSKLGQNRDSRKPRRRVRKRLLFTLATLCIGILLTLFAAEGALRLWHHFQPKPEEANLYVVSKNKLRRFHHRPGARLKKSGNVPVNINSLGFRGREYPSAKGSGVRRILVLGDSVTFGLFVKEEKLFTNVLEKLLNEGEGAFEYEVLNSGVSGYNVWNELGTLQQDG